jgi:DNA-directed RNA polymerase specialized sigma24 family protein
MKPVHVDPSEAVAAARVLEAGPGVGVHFGTFPQADDGIDEPTADVAAALGRLSVDRREAVILHHVQGLSFQEVGSVLGITTMAAKLRSHRAMGELRGILKEGATP